jgi:hypothetical protein
MWSECLCAFPNLVKNSSFLKKKKKKLGKVFAKTVLLKYIQRLFWKAAK